jgi:hypothetical protein
VVVLLKQSKIKSEKASYIKTTKKPQNWCKKPQFFLKKTGIFLKISRFSYDFIMPFLSKNKRKWAKTLKFGKSRTQRRAMQ